MVKNSASIVQLIRSVFSFRPNASGVSVLGQIWTTLFWLCCLWVTSCAFKKESKPAFDAEGDVVISNVNIVDVEQGAVHANQDVVITGRRISYINRHPASVHGLHKIDGTAKYLIPGLWDMHVHIVDSSYLAMFAGNGVTGVRDMGGAATGAYTGCESIVPGKLIEWRRLIRAGAIPGPRLIISGPPVTNTGWPTSLNIRTPEEARRAVHTLQAMGVDFIKIYEKIPIDAYLALAIEAGAKGLSFAGHVPMETVSLIEAAVAGQRSVEHVRDPLLMCFTKDKAELLEFFRLDNWSANDIEWGLNRFNECPRVVEALRQYQTWLVPTLAVEHAKVAALDPGRVNDPRRRRLPQSVQKNFAEYVNRKQNLSLADKKSDSLWWIAQKKLVTRMHNDGVRFLAGTDCACEGGLPGFSIHEELRLFTETGFTPLEALQTATLNPARYFNSFDSLGSVSQGKIADLVVLNGNPLTDIAQTSQIHVVIADGKVFFPDDMLNVKSTKITGTGKGQATGTLR